MSLVSLVRLVHRAFFQLTLAPTFAKILSNYSRLLTLRFLRQRDRTILGRPRTDQI